MEEHGKDPAAKRPTRHIGAILLVASLVFGALVLAWSRRSRVVSAEGLQWKSAPKVHCLCTSRDRFRVLDGTEVALDDPLALRGESFEVPTLPKSYRAVPSLTAPASPVQPYSTPAWRSYVLRDGPRSDHWGSRNNFMGLEVKNGELVELWEKPQYESRGVLFKALVREALAAFPGLVPDVVFAVTTSDRQDGVEVQDSQLYPLVGTTLGYPVPLPDPFIVGYPEIEGMASLEQFATWGEEYSKDHPWDTRKEAWVWVGSVAVSPDRRVFVDASHRLAERRPDPAPFLEIHDAPPPFSGQPKSGLSIPMRGWAEYRHCIDLRGNGYSARLPNLFLMGCTVWVARRPPELYAYWWPLMQEGVHYLALAPDGSDLEDRIAWARQHPEECAEVARRGREMMRFIMQRSHLHEYIVRTLLMLWAQGVDVPYCTGSEACSD